MRDTAMHIPAMQKQYIQLTQAEQAQLNMIIDLLIPSDHEFPPPSSLHLVDEILQQLTPNSVSQSFLYAPIRHLRSVLTELDIAAEGNFCRASKDLQQSVLHQLERRDPAFFQSLWTLTNHSYYTHLARLQTK